MVEFLKENNDYDVPLNLRKELEDSILAHNVMPSMRLLMTAGDAAKKNNIAAYNCLSGETLVITKEYGTVSISSLEGKKVHIIDGDGNWTLSECKCYGEDNLYEISLTTPGIASDYIIRSTKNHDWYLTNKTKTQTSELKIGDDLLDGIVPNRIKIEENSLEYKKGIIHGIIYGDGTASYKGRGSSSKLTSSEKLFNGFLIRLCGSSIELKSYFDEMDYSVSYPKSYNGEPVYYIPNPTIDLKSLPNEEYFTIDYLVGFIRGWMAADGTVTIGGQVSLACNNEGKEWFFKNGPKCGFYIRNCRKYLEETNYGKRLKSLYCLDLDRRWLFDEDIILNYKKEKFKKIKKIKKGWSGKIKSIKNLNVKEKVYCFDVPTTHSFMLYKNIMTGNCCFLPLDDFKSFDEMMAILMSGTGVGFSVENFFTKNLAELPDELYESNTTIVFEDSRLGWSKGYREFIYLLLSGQIPKYDVSKLRPAGARLKTMGGRSSGPEPLVDLLQFTVALFKKAKGRKITTLEAHDLGCKIADIVVVGGVRRSALISLSDLNDNKMREAKTGQWWTNSPHRRLANNSAVYNEKPDIGTFMKEWLSLYESKSGERGIFARNAIKTVIDNSNAFRKILDTEYELRDREYQDDFGTNPCSEIILRPYQFCNLTSVQIYADDTFETINNKIRLATILGTFQSCLTNFKYINKRYKKNCEEERLLGVSLNGIFDNELTNGYSIIKSGVGHSLIDRLCDWKKTAIVTNAELAKEIGIPSSVAITCVKPEGTSSALNGVSSGIHPAHSPYYIRYARNDLKDPLTAFMIDAGFPYEKDAYDPNNVVAFKFPIKPSESAVFKHNITAIEHLKLWKIYQQYWCEHKPSVSISVKESEWLDVGAWCYQNFEWLSGVAFFPADESTTIYKQAPFTTCDQKEYERVLAMVPKNVDWSKLSDYELEDSTKNSMDLACSSGNCDVI
jgi:ribonucleoside-triphosphate reductase